MNFNPHHQPAKAWRSASLGTMSYSATLLAVSLLSCTFFIGNAASQDKEDSSKFQVEAETSDTGGQDFEQTSQHAKTVNQAMSDEELFLYKALSSELVQYVTTGTIGLDGTRPERPSTVLDRKDEVTPSKWISDLLARDKEVNSNQKLSEEVSEFVAEYRKKSKAPPTRNTEKERPNTEEQPITITLPPEFFKKLDEPKQQVSFPNPRKHQPCAPTGLSNAQVALKSAQAGRELGQLKISLKQLQSELEEKVARFEDLNSLIDVHYQIYYSLSEQNKFLHNNSLNIVKRTKSEDLYYITEYKEVYVGGELLHDVNLKVELPFLIPKNKATGKRYKLLHRNYHLLGPNIKLVQHHYGEYKSLQKERDKVLMELNALKEKKDEQIKKRDNGIRFISDLLRGCGAKIKLQSVSD